MPVRTFKDEAEALEFVNTLPWGTAAGTTKDPKMAIRYAEAGVKVVTFGSITWAARAGNSGDNFYFINDNSINALGIPNAGFAHYLQPLRALKRELNSRGAELWVSISAGNEFIADEYHRMTYELFVLNAADVVAGNFSCPNIEVNGKRKPVVCFDPSSFREGVAAMRRAAGNQGRIAAKIAPLTEASLLGDIVDIALEYDVDYLECANTIPNCYLEKPDGTPAISVVRGGLAGAALVPLVCGMIQIIKPRLTGTKTKLIAIGGVQQGQTAYAYLKLGADGFQFNTALSRYHGRPDAIPYVIMGGDLEPGLVTLLVKHGI